MQSSHGFPEGPSDPIDYERLEGYLTALSNRRRLELLRILQMPRALADIRLKPGKHRMGDRPDRPVARQTLQHHLEALQQIGVVVATEPKARGKEFIVDPQRIYQILEELRAVGTLTAGAFVSRNETVDASAPRGRKVEPGPKFVLVHGFVEGKVFPLRRVDQQEGGGWTIGRKAGLQVCLDYDPFVSLVNSEVRLERDEYRLLDLGISRNGTWVNWRRVGPEPAPLRPGDVVGVGRSLLVFQRE